MSEEQAAPENGGETKAYTAPATQADFDRMVADRLSRQAAKYADYDAYKAKAAEFDKAAEASKSDLQKVIDRATKAESEAAALPAKVAESLRTHLVALGVVAKEDEVLLTAADPEALLAQVKRLSERSNTRKKGGNVVPREGQSNTSTTANPLADFTHELFGQKE